ncbi:MAG TPA: branched-chain amino acid ABC transporter permease [Acetobacteraceae bacterium]|nr:branched-chain amino acid ABC transporter permease [Acetobacteraceae bacterium]
MIFREAGTFKTSYAADMALYPLPVSRWTLAGIFVVLLLVLPLLASPYMLTICDLILVAVVGAIGLNILTGFAGQISIGQGGFMAVGAYTAAKLATVWSMPFWLAIPAAGLMTALIGVFVGIPSLRIKGFYLTIATLAAQFIIEWIINHVTWISGGIQATIQMPPPRVFGVTIQSQLQFYFFLLAFAVIATVAAKNFARSRLGRACIAVRDQDIAAEIIGIDIARTKLIAFAISCFVVGVAGALYSYYLGIANYEQFGLDVSIDYLAMIIIGGQGSVNGSILGAAFITLLPVVTRRTLAAIGPMFLGGFDIDGVLPEVRLCLFGGLIIVFLVAEPEGLDRLWRNVRTYFRTWPFSY